LENELWKVSPTARKKVERYARFKTVQKGSKIQKEKQYSNSFKKILVVRLRTRRHPIAFAPPCAGDVTLQSGAGTATTTSGSMTVETVNATFGGISGEFTFNLQWMTWGVRGHNTFFF
jgi:hypothetical protein